MKDTLQAWDEALLLLLNGTPEWLSGAGWWLSQPWCSTPVYLFVIWRLFKGVPWRTGALRMAMVLVTFAGTDAISSRVLKPGFERLRPSHNPSLSTTLVLHQNQDGTVYRGGRFGFVSSHASNTFGLAAIAFLILGKSATRWLWVWAGVVSWTRLYLGVHYPGDIVFGSLFGIGFAAATHVLFSRFITPKPTP
ncbi:phosphatase PAP2 family protein [Flavobacteriales bacterium]|nr:phosphatase PAP2 family protein [Flavobacteriales bacterium]